MATGTKIVVHEGGTLIMSSGSIITNAGDYNLSGSCTDLWHGIVVLGDPTQSQEDEFKKFCQNKFANCNAEGGDGGAFECVGAHPQGVLYADGAEIRNANVAVSVGDLLNPYEYGTSFYSPLNSANSGGWVYLKNCTFRNNKRISISFAAYDGFQQKSIVQNNLFLTNFNS